MEIRRRLLPLLLALGAAALSAPARAQLVIGQYETEAPTGTWNSFPFWTAASLGRGGTVYASASGPGCAFANPASAARLTGLSLGLGGSLRRAEFFRFGAVNTGLLTSRDNLALNLAALDWGGISVKLGRWAFALNAALAEDYDRPRIDFDQYEDERLVYAYEWSQKGFLRTIHLALARELGSKLAVGLGVGFLSGATELVSEENFAYAYYVIGDSRERNLSGFYLNAGLLWEVRPSFRLALALRTPFMEKADSTSALSFRTRPGGTAFVIRGWTTDKSRQPAALGVGTSWTVVPRLRFALDMTFLNWASYEAVYFGETKRRDFRNVLKLGAGFEFAPEVRLWGTRLTLPLRAGFISDPQPMKNPRSAYRIWTIGAGAALKRVSIDIGAGFGAEGGSGRNLRTARASASLGVAL